MSKIDPDTLRLLTEYHLDLLDDEARAAVKRRLDAEPDLSACLARISASLKPLDSWTPAQPPADLNDRIMTRVAQTSPLQYVASSSRIGPDPQARPKSKPVISIWELGALAACVAIFMSIFVPGMANVRSRQLQARCGDNLASLGRGFELYSAANDDFLPSIGQTSANWLQRPNRMHMAPAIKYRFVVPASMFCPGAKVDGDAKGITDSDQTIHLFLGRRRPWYSTQNQNGPLIHFKAHLRVPLASDPNPVFENGKYNPKVPWDARSRTHDGRGQNVLLSDGSVMFIQQPKYGRDHDNIWRAEPIDRYTGVEAQHSATDAFLIP